MEPVSAKDPLVIPSPAYNEEKWPATAGSSSSTLRSPFSTSPFSSLSAWWAAKRVDLPHPGSRDAVGREVQNVHGSHLMFDGARADLTKGVSMNPLFQVTHAFALGGAQGPQVNPGSYNFGAVYGSDRFLLQGSVEGDGNVNGRFNTDTPLGRLKLQTQLSRIPDNNVMVGELEGSIASAHDNSYTIKAFNPSLANNLAGNYTFSYLQSITSNLALGIDATHNRSPTGQAETGYGYLAKYVSNAKDWIASAILSPAATLQLSYWQKLSDRVEAGAELAMIPAVDPAERKAVATLGAKYDYRAANFRAQVDSTGKMAVLLEQRINGMMAILVSGEIDQWKHTSKFGIGVQLESSSLSPEEMQAQSAGGVHPPM